MRPGILLRVLALLLIIPAAGCFQQVGQVPRDLEVELLPARRSERSVVLQATSSLPITVIAPTPLQDGPAIAPTVAVAAGGLFITPRSPDVPSMAEGESGGIHHLFAANSHLYAETAGSRRGQRRVHSHCQRRGHGVWHRPAVRQHC